MSSQPKATTTNGPLWNKGPAYPFADIHAGRNYQQKISKQMSPPDSQHSRGRCACARAKLDSLWGWTMPLATLFSFVDEEYLENKTNKKPHFIRILDLTAKGPM